MNHLIIFIRNPILGKVKNRLARTIGDEQALMVYEKLLRHTLEVTQAVPAEKRLYYSEQVADHDMWPNDHFLKFAQKGPDLGERMKNALRTSFTDGAKKVVIMGSDCYEIEPGHIEGAFRALDGHDFAIGPALDGGYYLLGMKQPANYLFEGIRWSTEFVYDESRKAIISRGFTLEVLDQLRDIDERADLIHYKELYQYIR